MLNIISLNCNVKTQIRCESESSGLHALLELPPVDLNWMPVGFLADLLFGWLIPKPFLKFKKLTTTKTIKKEPLEIKKSKISLNPPKKVFDITL